MSKLQQPLHQAVAGGCIDRIILLQRYGAKCKAATERGPSAIRIAALCNNTVWSLLAHLNDEREVPWLAGERIGHFSETFLHLAAALTPDIQLGERFLNLMPMDLAAMFGTSAPTTGTRAQLQRRRRREMSCRKVLQKRRERWTCSRSD